MRFEHSLALSALVFVAACGGGGDRAPSGDTPGSTSTPAATPAATPGPSGTASIRGTVRLTGTAPANPTIDMGDEPKCKERYATTPRDPKVVAGAGGVLANAFVYVKAGLPAGASYPPAAAPVEIDQEGCLYKPRVLGLMVGQQLAIKNGDPLLHNIKALPKGNRPFNISQPTAGMTTVRTFATPEVMIPLECNVHGWMHAFVGVLPHPYFATTASDGTFSIPNLPAGTYTIEVWHETLGTHEASVTVGDGETKTADFTLRS